MSESKTFTSIRKLRNAAEQVRTFEARFTEETAKRSCDKYGIGFTHRDRRFSTLQAEVHLVAYTGYYGSSSCTTFSLAALSNEELAGALNHALEENRTIILQSMANILDAKALNLYESAQKELAEMQAELDHLKEMYKD